MNEEIDIIELLKRVKEGKAPKRIEVEDFIFYYNNKTDYISEMYQSNTCYWETKLYKGLNTKIKILDKPIIEELEIKDDGSKYISPDTFEITAKVNEIIKWINEKNYDIN